MSGGSKKQTVGYWYKRLFHAGLCKGPIDAFLEIRGADKTAWKGGLAASATLTIDQPKLWGGEKDQGGIVSDIDVLFGESTQVANAYLLANLGSQVPAWRGLTSLVFKGGKFGAINPYPQKMAYKLRRIKEGWDSGCWYPETAEVGMDPGLLSIAASDPWEYVVGAQEADPGYTNLTPPGSGWATAAGPYGDVAAGGYNGLWPNATTLWLRQIVDLGVGRVTRISAAAENGCVVLVNGVVIGGINRSNQQATQTGDTFVFDVHVDGPATVAIKGFDEDPPGGTTALAINIAQLGLTAINPAHALYYSRTSAENGREPTANIDDASLRAAADTLHAEGFGICTTRDPAQESPEEFEDRICRLIDGSFSRDPISGKWHLDLARGNYVLASLPILGDDDILEFREVPSALDNAVNSVSVTYFDPERKEQITTPPVQARAPIAAFGTIHQTLDYPEIPTAALAARVALRELKARATPTRSYELVCTRRPYAWRPSTYFRLQAPKRGIADMVCILGEKNSGSLKSGAIRIKATQDIYTLPVLSFAQTEPGIDTRPSQAAAVIVNQVATEAPWVSVVGALAAADLAALPVGAGYVLVAAADPAVSVNYTITVDAGGGYAEVGNGDWCPTGTASAAATRTTTAVTIAGGSRLDEVVVGSVALWDAEIVRVDAINAGTGAATLARGCADTVPADHAAGSRIWFVGSNDVADETQYTSGEAINVKLLANTASQQTPVASATALPVTFADRITRPYPPARVKIAGADWPATVSGSFAVAWAHRNRVTQSDQIVDTTATSITPADNIRYGLRFRRTDTNAVLVERSDIGPPSATVTLTYTGAVSLELWTIDDAGVSWQSHLCTFGYTPPVSPTNTITATAYTPVFGGTIIDAGDLDA